jgi:alanyl-tRNA synthetase
MHYAEKVDNVVLHHVDGDVSDDVVGKKVEGKLDWDRRITLARHHTGTHLVIAAARKVLGQHIWQAGSQNDLTRARIDLSHYKRITQDELNEIEKLANEYVMANIDLDIQFHTRDEAQELYGFVLYQGGIVPGKMIRVVKVPGVDVQACAGTHVLRTGVVGPIKINKTERVQDGVERIDFSAGLAAIDSMQHDSELLRESSGIFKVENDQLPKTCDRFFSEWKSQKNEIDRLKSEIASLKMNSLADEYDEINGLKVVHQLIDSDFKELQKMATDFTDNGKADVVVMGNSDGKIVGAASQAAIDSGIKINEIIKTAAGVLGGGGGGRLTLAQGAGKNADKMDEAIQTAVDLIKG